MGGRSRPAPAPGIAALLPGRAAVGEAACAEWAWTGMRGDGTPFVMRGVTIQGVRQDRIAWSRL